MKKKRSAIFKIVVHFKVFYYSRCFLLVFWIVISLLLVVFLNCSFDSVDYSWGLKCNAKTHDMHDLYSFGCCFVCSHQQKMKRIIPWCILQQLFEARCFQDKSGRRALSRLFCCLDRGNRTGINQHYEVGWNWIDSMIP